MADMIDYISWRGDLTFDEREVNIVDILIMSQFALLDLNGVVEKRKVSLDAMRNKMYKIGRADVPVGLLAPRDMVGLMNAAADSERFKKVKLHNRIEITDTSNDTQITALTADLPNNVRIVIFSGTGDTIVAWKEDFNLMYKEIPAQKVATEYLEEMARNWYGELYVTGHSKGGHLTLYSAVNCDKRTRAKITAAYSFDGPGLNEKQSDNLVESPIYDRIYNVIPEGSIVGRLFCHKEQTRIVRSDNTGLIQHDAFNWYVTKDGFEYSDKNLDWSDEINALTKNIIDEMDDKKREEFTEAFYKVLYGSGATTLTDLMSKGKETLEAYRNLSSEEKSVLLEISNKLMGDRTVRKLLVENIKSSLQVAGIHTKVRNAIDIEKRNLWEIMKEGYEEFTDNVNSIREEGLVRRTERKERRRERKEERRLLLTKRNDNVDDEQ